MKFYLLFALLFSLGSWANECGQDAVKFCQGIDPGRGQIARCLSDYANQISPACLKELKGFKAKTAELNPCFQDLAEFCVDIPNGNLHYCLLKNETKLSAKCAADFKPKKGNLLVKDSCVQDVADNCYTSVSGPEGSILRCLIKNTPKLSVFCKKSVEKKVTLMKQNNACYAATEKHCPTQVLFIDIQDCLEKKVNTLDASCKKLVQAEQKKAAANPCYKDLLRHCRRGISVDDQHRCLVVNEKEISNACKQYRVKEEDRIKKMIELCEPDRLKICGKVPMQNGAVTRCLRENKTKLDKKCAELI